MSTSRNLPFQKRHAWLAWCVVVALVLRSLIPVGYMPDVSHKAHVPFGITICGGMHHANDAGDKNKGDAKTQDNAPCPFAAASNLALNNDDAAALAPLAVFLALIRWAAFAFSSQRRHRFAAPRAPPVFS